MYGWSEAEALTKNSLDLVSEAKRGEMIDLYKRLAKGENIPSFETQRIARDGKVLDVWLTLTVLVNDANQPISIATTERDITERNRTGRQLVFENRASRALTHWYQIFVEGNQRTALFEEACRILVKVAGYRLAWIGWAIHQKSESITPAYWAGLDEEKLATLANGCRSAVESALIGGRPVAIRNILSDSAYSLWRADAVNYDYGSFIVLPLIEEKVAHGVLVIYAAEQEAFVDPEVQTLVMLSVNIARALGLDKK